MPTRCERVRQLVGRRVHADRDPGQQPGAQGGRLEDRRDLHRPADGTGQRIREDGIVRHAAVDAERRDRVAAVMFGRLDEISASLRHALEDGAHDLGPAGAPRETDEGAAGAEVPDGCARVPSKAGTNHTSPDVSHCAATRSDSSALARMLRSSRSHSMAVPAESMTASVPHVARPPTRNATIGKVPRLASGDPGGAVTRSGALVEHAPGAEGRLGQARQGAALADQRGLLVPGDPADGGRSRQRARRPDRPRGVDDRGQHGARDPQPLEQTTRPSPRCWGRPARSRRHWWHR